jgi:SAM-dependent methyltransferase
MWKSGGLVRDLQSDDLRISDSQYGLTLPLLRCDMCGFVFAPYGEIANLTTLYEDLLDHGYEGSQEPRILQMRWLLDKALDANPGTKTLLDIGAGTGLLVREARGRGIDARGVEPSKALVDSGRKENGVEIEQGVYPHPRLVGMEFDTVLLVDVIEHVADPMRLLADCREALAPGGVLVVVTPDVSSLAARMFGDKWWHYRLAHVCYFDRGSFGRAVDNAGLSSVRWLRAKWFISIGYLADRLKQYLPVGWFNGLAERIPAIGWLYRRVIPFNIHDSYVVFLKKKSEGLDE